MNWLIKYSKPGIIIAVFVVQMASFALLFSVGDQFEAAAGHEAFDFQNTLTVEAVQEQLTSYTDEARQIYVVFAVVDFVFPLAGALFLTLLTAFLLRTNPAQRAQRLLTFTPLILLTAVFDWLENVFLLIVIFLNPDAAGIAIVFKQLKLIGIQVSGFAVLAALVYNIGYRVYAMRPRSQYS